MSYLTPDPNQLRAAQSLLSPLGPGSAVSTGVPVSAKVPIAGARLVTIRALVSCAGTLTPTFAHPDGDTLYTVSNPTAIAVSDNTEIAETITCSGEAVLDLTFTPSGNGVVSFVHILQL